MAAYELVCEIFNQCSGNQMRDVDFQEIEVEDTDAYLASIEPSWRGAYGCAYANSGETARAVALFNTLLGCWNQPGGALLT